MTIVTDFTFDDHKHLFSNFTQDELSCKHCGQMLMDLDFLLSLQRLREELGFALPVTSGYRCEQHPAEMEKETTGAHPQGKAVDIRTYGMRAYLIIEKAMAIGFTGIGVSQKDARRFVHLDMNTEGLPRPMVWSY